jgi:hypothetical protein
VGVSRFLQLVEMLLRGISLRDMWRIGTEL